MRPPGTPPGYVLWEGCILIREEELLSRSYHFGSAWPDGIVPIQFDPNLNQSERDGVLDALRVCWSTNARIQFKYRDGEPDFINVTRSPIPNVSFSTSVGRQDDGGQQQVQICDTGWGDLFHVTHEFFHAIGFFHEQSRPDRDGYVEIMWSHIPVNRHSQFEIQPDSDTLGTPYDYMSIMHYDECLFSTCASACAGDLENCRTIRTLDPSYQTAIGNRLFISAYDALDLRLVYGEGRCYYLTGSYCPSQLCPRDGSIAAPFRDHVTFLNNGDNTTGWFLGGTSYSVNNVNGGILSRPMTLKAHAGNALFVRQ